MSNELVERKGKLGKKKKEGGVMIPEDWMTLASERVVFEVPLGTKDEVVVSVEPGVDVIKKVPSRTLVITETTYNIEKPKKRLPKGKMVK